VHSYKCPFGPSRVKLTAHHNQLLWFCSNGLLLKQEQRVETSQLAQPEASECEAVRLGRRKNKLSPLGATQD
jgi:hypothetical protein